MCRAMWRMTPPKIIWRNAGVTVSADRQEIRLVRIDTGQNVLRNAVLAGHGAVHFGLQAVTGKGGGNRGIRCERSFAAFSFAELKDLYFFGSAEQGHGVEHGS